MKPKAICKIIIDILMTCALLFLMGYQFWGDVAHEWVGAGMFLAFILHHILNRRWYLSLFRGRWTPAHIISAALDLLLFLTMLGLMGIAVYGMTVFSGEVCLPVCWCALSLYFWISASRFRCFIWIIWL